MGITLTSCLDFEFESAYEDINGIYLERVMSYPFGGTKLDFNGDIGYIISGNSMYGYEFADIDSVSLLNTYETSSTITDFQIVNGYAFLALPNERLEIVDLHGPSPTFVGSSETAVAYIAVAGDYVYGYLAKDLAIFDISNITQPVHAGTFDFDVDINQLKADSNYLYVLLDNGVFHLMDLETPTGPFIVSTIDTFFFLSFAIKDDYIYLARHGRVLTYQISENSGLVNVATLKSPANFLSLSVSGNHCVGFSSSTFVFLLDMEYPFLPFISEYIDIYVQARQALIHGDYIYVLTRSHRLEIIEVKRVDQ